MKKDVVTRKYVFLMPIIICLICFSSNRDQQDNLIRTKVIKSQEVLQAIKLSDSLNSITIFRCPPEKNEVSKAENVIIFLRDNSLWICSLIGALIALITALYKLCKFFRKTFKSKKKQAGFLRSD